ncbi:KH domain-containing protein [Granulicella sp. dw_53]|uniref:KH domain-containing protein n=1 Tax=Granulicella sp. dw_53 TaxID=2719792 RepID=UPI001BD23D96|nr:KH domain-containing protein [Granulicella sp. dw_53]
MTDTDTLAATDVLSQNMVELVKGIACALVDSPDKVLVEALKDGEGTLLRLRVAPTDVGKVIGKQGRTARSMRTILSAASMKMKHRFALDIIEDETKSLAS